MKITLNITYSCDIDELSETVIPNEKDIKKAIHEDIWIKIKDTSMPKNIGNLCFELDDIELKISPTE